jgi:hypothetical protein
MREKTFFQLLPKGKLMAALSMILLLVAVLYARRHAVGAMEQLKKVIDPGAAPDSPDPTRRVRLAPPPPASRGGSTSRPAGKSP